MGSIYLGIPVADNPLPPCAGSIETPGCGYEPFCAPQVVFLRRGRFWHTRSRVNEKRLLSFSLLTASESQNGHFVITF